MVNNYRNLSFTFSKLSENVKELVVSTHNDINLDYEWWRPNYEGLEELAELCGVYRFKCEGFNLDRGQSISMQGSIDFISLRDFVKNKTENYALLNTLKECAKGCIPKKMCGETYKVLNSNSAELYAQMESFRNDTVIEGYNNYGDVSNKRVSSELDLCAEGCIEFLTEFKNVCFKMLHDSYDYLSSEVAIIETIEANEYRFKKDGTRA
jgi:hypothetical protein